MIDGSCMVDDTVRPIVGTYKGLLLDFGYGPVTDAYAISLQRIGTGAVDALSLITAEVGLDGVGTAFDWLSDPNEHVKIIVRPELTRTPVTP
jgi:(R,R)-butanediol dehydrogenase / meso-butanediol dehydrogenase / diacetyl reductase